MFVPVIPSQPSPRAQELGQKMAELIRIFREKDPSLSFPEIRMAMGIAETQVRSEFHGARWKTTLVLAMLMGMVLLGLGLVFFLFPSGSLPPHLILMLVIGLAVLVLGVLVAVKR